MTAVGLFQSFLALCLCLMVMLLPLSIQTRNATIAVSSLEEEDMTALNVRSCARLCVGILRKNPMLETEVSISVVLNGRQVLLRVLPYAAEQGQLGSPEPTLLCCAEVLENGVLVATILARRIGGRVIVDEVKIKGKPYN